MTTRRVRMHDLLQMVGIEPDFPRSSSGDFQRSVHKDELVTIARRLGTDIDPHEKKQFIKQAVLEDVLGRPSNKSPSSQLNARDLFKIVREIDHRNRLDAESLYDDLFGDLPWRYASIPRRSDVVVNGREYTTSSTRFRQGHTKSHYDKYIKVELSQRLRVMILFDLDTDECTYTHPVVLEEKVDYGPYARWKRAEYVHDFEVKDEVVPDLLCEVADIEVGDELKFEEPRVWLEVDEIKGNSPDVALECTSSNGANYDVYYSRRRNNIRVTRVPPEYSRRYDNEHYGTFDAFRTR